MRRVREQRQGTCVMCAVVSSTHWKGDEQRPEDVRQPSSCREECSGENSSRAKALGPERACEADVDKEESPRWG